MDIEKEESYYVDGMESYLHCLSSFALAHPGNYQPHYHFHEYIELLYCLEGEGIVWINEKPNTFLPGSLIIVNSQKAHDVQFRTDTSYLCVKFSPHILYESENPFQIFKYAVPFISEEQNRYVFPAEQISGTPIEALLLEIIAEWNGKKDAYAFMIRANILKIFATIFRLWNASGNLPPEITLTPEIKEAIAYTSEHYQTVTLKEAAEVCGLSYNYFSQLFHRCVGIRYRDYLMLLRISESERLLLTTSKSITEVAEETGFSATSHFIASFRKQIGITPAKFRKVRPGSNSTQI